ncbi:MAG: tRNA (adenosine(37)-N6)-threonylcarbamoyltransferase complex ATPase subunit type 1 TsaE [Natronospirillum sp.]
MSDLIVRVDKSDTRAGWILPNEEATVLAGKKLSDAGDVTGAVIYLEGDLGMGKTTLVRAFLHGLGWTGTVKSPTYTLVEPYEWDGHRVYHFDLYRLGDPEELEFMGIRDYVTFDTLMFVEWPGKGAGALPKADMTLTLQEEGEGRRLTWQHHTPKGEIWASVLHARSPA